MWKKNNLLFIKHVNSVIYVLPGEPEHPYHPLLFRWRAGISCERLIVMRLFPEVDLPSMEVPGQQFITLNRPLR